jgi:hypothetical protein
MRDKLGLDLVAVDVSTLLNLVVSEGQRLIA